MEIEEISFTLHFWEYECICSYICLLFEFTVYQHLHLYNFCTAEVEMANSDVNRLQ